MVASSLSCFVSSRREPQLALAAAALPESGDVREGEKVFPSKLLSFLESVSPFGP
jgi:hypothetical protein